MISEEAERQGTDSGSDQEDDYHHHHHRFYVLVPCLHGLDGSPISVSQKQDGVGAGFFAARMPFLTTNQFFR